MPSPDFTALEAKYRLPSGLLAAQQAVESSGGRDLTSEKGAQGPAQLMPATARALGVNPHDPMQAAEAQARLNRENLDATGGDIDKAMMRYYGGTDTQQWGPKTQAYPGKILAALQKGTPSPTQAQADPADPFEAALAGNAAAVSNDPFEAALAGNGTASHDNVPDTAAGRPAEKAADNPGGNPGYDPGQTGGPAAGAVAQPEGLARKLAAGALDLGSGISEGYDRAQDSLVGLGARATDAIGLTQGMHDRINQYEKDNAGARDGDFYTPDGYSRAIGKFIGESIPMAPLAELKVASAAPEAGRLAQGLAKYGNMSAQGAIGGALQSGGNDIAQNAAFGAVAAPALGAALEKAIIPGVAAIGRGAAKLVPQSARQKIAAAMADLRTPTPGAAEVGADGSGAPFTQKPIRVIKKPDGTETQIFSEDNALGLTGEVSADAPASQYAFGGNRIFPRQPIRSTNLNDGGHMSEEGYAYRTMSQNEFNDAKDKGAFLPKQKNPRYGGEKQWADGGAIEPYNINGSNYLVRVPISKVSPDVPVRFSDAEVVHNPVSGMASSVPTPAIAAADLGAAGSRSGIEAHPTLPASVADDVTRLKAEGVQGDHAMNEAAMRYVGAEPTVATSTRNRAAMQAEKEGAKLSTPEGQALAERAASNNAALHQTVQETVQGYGGVPADGSAAQSAAETLAKASDAAKAKVNEAYTAADQEASNATVEADVKRAAQQAQVDQQAATQAQDAARAKLDAAQEALRTSRVSTGKAGDIEKARAAVDKARADLRSATSNPPKGAPVPLDAPGYIDMAPLSKALDNPELSNPTVEGAATLRSGVKGLIKAYSGGSGKVNLQQAESIRQAIGSAYDQMGGGINHHVGELKSVLDKTLDEASDAPSYKAARALHKAWAEKYDDPEGIARLIRRNAKGDFLNSGNWRATEQRLVNGTSDKAFTQVVRQLKASGGGEAISRLKASIVQDAYERATNSAADETGNPVMSAKMWNATLNKIGLPKLKAIFSDDEIAHLATIGRAARALNEGVPGTVNGSGTASALVNALAAAQGKAPASAAGGVVSGLVKTGAHILASPAGPGGHAAVEVGAAAANMATGARSKAANAKALAKALQDSMDPASARQTANDNALSEATKAARRATAEKLAKALAPASASNRNSQ